MFFHKKKISLLMACLISSSAYAENAARYVIAPSCLLNNANQHFNILAKQNDLVLIQTDKNGIATLNQLKVQQKTPCGGFVDVGQHFKLGFNLKAGENLLSQFQAKPATLSTEPTYQIQHEKEVTELLKNINSQNMWDNLTTLTNFKDRYANSENGVKAASWFKESVEKLAQNYHRDDVNVYTISTGSYKQPSVVAKIGEGEGPGIVVSAHMDTLESTFSKKPGADDDGSGSVTILEAARTILASGMHFKKPVYFIWYAAEEEGLVGSSYVVKEFQNKKIPVEAVLHFDLTGYAHQNESTMWLIDDNVNKNLTNYLETLIQTYVKQPIKHTRCGYACSDHATWTRNGYAAAIPAESAFENTNPNIHSSRDTMDKLSLKHMTDYTKLTVAFTVEMAEPA